MEINHSFNDEELYCLLEAKKLFKERKGDERCEGCMRAWNLIDQAILARYTLLAKEDKEKKDA